jgi:hypothetical protein
MKFRIFLLVLSIAGYAAALDYDPVNDNYNPNDYTVEVIPVATATDVYNAKGTHSYFVWLQNKPDTTNVVYFKPNDPKPYTETKITPNDGSQKKTCIANMNYLNGYYRYVINIYLKSSSTGIFTNSGNFAYNNILVASAYILGKPSNPAFENVVVLADGIDFSDGMRTWTNARSVFDIATNPAFDTIVQPTGESMIGKGYNLCFIDFEIGSEDIRFNAKVMLKVIEKICESSGSSKVTVGGFSMGGQVSRLALLYGQKKVNGQPAAKILKVNKFLSIDSPNKGASGASVSFQNFIQRNDDVTYLDQINRPASKQMLFVHNTCTPANLEHDKFYSFLSALGNFPNNMRLISIADADWTPPAHTGTALHIGSVFHPELEGFSWQESDFLAGSSTGSTMSLINGKVDDFNGGFLKRVFINLLFGSDVKVTLSPHCEPTFMPVTSVFCLKDNTPANLQNANSLSLLVQGKWTPFHSLYQVTKRQAHIAFTQELNALILKALYEPGIMTTQTGFLSVLLK